MFAEETSVNGIEELSAPLKLNPVSKCENPALEVFYILQSRVTVSVNK